MVLVISLRSFVWGLETCLVSITNCTRLTAFPLDFGTWPKHKPPNISNMLFMVMFATCLGVPIGFFGVVWVRPAPYRVGSGVAGSWTGALCFGDCPIRHVPCVWPSDEYTSGRVMISVAQLGGFQITSATVYCPAKGPTFPNARALSEELLAPITENLVFWQRRDPGAIVGDFNCAAGQLQQMRFVASPRLG